MKWGRMTISEWGIAPENEIERKKVFSYSFMYKKIKTIEGKLSSQNLSKTAGGGS